MRSLMARGDLAVNAGGTWLRELAFAVVQRWPEPPLHQSELLAEFIGSCSFFNDAWDEEEIPHAPPRFLPFHPTMGPRRWPVRQLDTIGDLSSWLGLDDGELAWFADRRGLERGVSAAETLHANR